jgi:hypothetical protein
LGKYAEYDACKVHIDAMAYADNEQEYEYNWAVIKIKFHFAVSYLET